MIDWVAKQKLSVVRRLRQLDSEPIRMSEFIGHLSKHCDVVPSAKVLELLYETWLAVPSEVIFEMACKTKLRELEQFTEIASQALLGASDVQDFELDNLASDPRDELLSWLRNRAIYNKPRY